MWQRQVEFHNHGKGILILLSMFYLKLITIKEFIVMQYSKKKLTKLFDQQQIDHTLSQVNSSQTLNLCIKEYPIRASFKHSKWLLTNLNRSPHFHVVKLERHGKRITDQPSKKERDVCFWYYQFQLQREHLYSPTKPGKREKKHQLWTRLNILINYLPLQAFSV